MFDAQRDTNCGVMANRQSRRCLPFGRLEATAAEVGRPAVAALPAECVDGDALADVAGVGKRVEVFKEAVPGITRLAILGNAENPVSQYSWEDTQPAARQLAIEPQLFMVRGSDELAGRSRPCSGPPPAPW